MTTETGKQPTNDFILIGKGEYMHCVPQVGFILAWHTRSFRDFEQMIRPAKILHRMETPLTRSQFHEEVLTEWWERRHGDHGGGRFDREHYIKYLQALIYKQ